MTRPAQPIRLPATPGPKSSLGDRVRWLIDNYWQANRKKCAEDLETHISYISRIAVETNNPGTDLLEKLAAKPFINTRWLLTGKESPYLAADKQSLTSWMLPVVSELPTGMIQQPSGLQARSQKEIDIANFATSRCWSQLSMGDELAHRAEYGFQVNDYLLWETNPAYWKDLSILYKRPAIVMDKSTGLPRHVVLDFQEETEDDPACVLCDDLVKSAPPKPALEREYILKVSKENGVRIENPPSLKRRGIMSVPPAWGTVLKELKRIVAVAVLSTRSY